MLRRQGTQNLREEFRDEGLVSAGKHHPADRGPDIVEERFELFTRELAGRPLENSVVTEMAHHAAQIALVNDVQAQSQSTARVERSPKARFEGLGSSEMVRHGGVRPAGQ